MYSFNDINGNVVPFECKRDLSLELQTDIASGDITAYLVVHNDHYYEVDKKTYDAIDNM